MDLPQLRTLVHVAELGSLSKAADRLRIAQPALSRQMRLLEEELGTSLFTRHGRGMLLTDAGHEVQRTASRIIAELDEMKSRIGEANSRLSGRVSIGLPPTVADILSVPLVNAVRNKHPDVDLRLVSAYTGHLMDWLQRGDIDFAVLYDPQRMRSLRSQPLVLETLYLVGGAKAKLSRNRPVPFTRLAKEILLLPSPRHGLRAIVERCAADKGIKLTVHVEADSYSTLKDLVRNGHGKTILPIAPIYDEIIAKRLAIAPLINPTPMRRLVVSQANDRPVTRLTRFASDTLRTVVRGLVEDGIWSGELLGSQQDGA